MKQRFTQMIAVCVLALLSFNLQAQVFTTQPQPYTGCLNDNVTLTVAATSAVGTVTYQWYEASSSCVCGFPLSGQTSNSYTVPYGNTGTTYYYCVASNGQDDTPSDVVEVTLNYPTTWYRDNDNDGFGDTYYPMDACSQPAGYVDNYDDCNDNDPAVSLLTFYYDGDGDGFGDFNQKMYGCDPLPQYVANSTDCNDGDGSSHESFPFYPDNDNDGYGDYFASPEMKCAPDANTPPPGYAVQGGDCNDGDYDVNPGATEICDGKDNNCDGNTDEGFNVYIYQQPEPTQTLCLNNMPLNLYVGDATNKNVHTVSSVTSVGSSYQWYVSNTPSITGGTPIANAQSNIYPPPTDVAGTKYYYCVVSSTCNGSSATSDIAEVIVNDQPIWYLDNDGDSYGDANMPLQACDQPAGYVDNNIDCNDNDNTIYPGATEIFGDNKDNNCDGSVDEYCPVYGNSSVSITSFKINQSPTYSSGSYNTYVDNTANILTVVSGAKNSTTIGALGGTNMFIGIYFDYNHDGDFDDQDEIVSLTPIRLTVGIGFFIPANNTYYGLTRMRVRLFKSISGTSPNPCGYSSNSQTMDFTVNLVCTPTTTPSVGGNCAGDYMLGTSSEADGTVIEGYVNNVHYGTGSVSANYWTIYGAPLAAGDRLVAIAIAPGKCPSDSSLPAYITDTTARPRVNLPLCAGSTIVSGTSTEADGTAINVNTNQGGFTGTVTGGAWSVTVAALQSGDPVEVRATASGKCTSIQGSAYHYISACGDVTPPTLDVSTDIVQNVTGCTATIAVPNPTYSDNVGVTSLTWKMTGATVAKSFPGIRTVGTFTFNMGVTTITYTAKDAAGNTTTKSFTVTITENVKPTITCTGALSGVANSSCRTVFTVPAAGVSDNCTVASLTWVMTGATTGNSAATGINQVGRSSFNTGVTTITYTVTDAAGNSDQCTTIVTVVDNMAPVFSTLPAVPVQVITTSGCTMDVAVANPVITENCALKRVSWEMTGATTGSSPSTGINYVGTKTFNAGVTVVTYTAEDMAGNISTGAFKVVVKEGTPPTVTCPPQQIISCATASGNYTINPVIATHNCPTTGAFTYSYRITGSTSRNGNSADASGAFSAGRSKIAWTVKDGMGNSTTCATVVVVPVNPCDVIPIAIASAKTGNWNSTSTWNCNCIPLSSSSVTVKTGHTVTVDNTANAGDLQIQAGGTLTFSTGKNLNLTGNLDCQGSFSNGSGSVTLNGSAAQTITGAGALEFYDLTLNNAAGATFNSAAGIRNSITATAGTFTAGSNAVTLISDATSTARMGITGATGGYSGSNWIIQRYISARNANYSDLASPVSNSTIGDWDQEIYMSGVGGNDGNACCPIYYSVYNYKEPTAAYVAVTSTNTALTPGKGFELFLGSNTTTLSHTTLDTRGTPTFGNKTIPVSRTASSPDPGWNLVGNLFASPIAWDNLQFTNLDATYYVFDNVTSTYAAYGAGTVIPSTQGFYVHSSSGTPTLTIPEAAKVASNSSVFLKPANEAKLVITNNVNRFSQRVSLKIGDDATDYFEGKYDALYLKSPVQTAPALYMLTPDNSKVVINTFSPSGETKALPLVVGAGVAGTYTISASDFENLLQAYSCIYIEDRKTNQRFDVVKGDSYSFTLPEGVNSTRFVLHLSKNNGACAPLAGKRTGDGLGISKATVNTYPNPTKGKFALTLENLRSSKGEVSIMAASGKVIQKRPFDFTTGKQVLNFNIASNPPGIYLVKVVSTEGVQTLKVVLE